MIPLDTAEELVLHAFHEMKRDRVGAEPGERLSTDYLDTIRQRDATLDVDGAVTHLQELGLVRRERGELVLTEDGAARLYPAHSGEGGVRSAS